MKWRFVASGLISFASFSLSERVDISGQFLTIRDVVPVSFFVDCLRALHLCHMQGLFANHHLSEWCKLEADDLLLTLPVIINTPTPA